MGIEVLMRRRRGFTLVELLVVIAIIAILIAIFLPVCIKVRRRALVLVCPIAYVGQDGGVYLTDPKGGYSLNISSPDPNGSAAVTPLSWSPSGQRLGSNCGGAYIFEPSSGKIWNNPNCSFGGWMNDDCFYIGYYRFAEVETRRQHYLSEPPYDQGMVDFISPTPLGSNYPYVGNIRHRADVDDNIYIAALGKNLELRKLLYEREIASLYGEGIDAKSAKIDPFNEYVAWGRGASLKPLKANSHEAQELPGAPWPGTRFLGETTFGDWTEDGNLLVCHDVLGLMIVSKEGKILRRLFPPVKPVPLCFPSYRKYGHTSGVIAPPSAPN